MSNQSKLITCPACGREGVSFSGTCPSCIIPVERYMKEMPYGDPANVLYECAVCEHLFDPEYDFSCPSCGEPVPFDDLPKTSHVKCPKCRSRRTERVDSKFMQRSLLEQMFTFGKSVYSIETFWCHKYGNVFTKNVG